MANIGICLILETFLLCFLWSKCASIPLPEYLASRSKLLDKEKQQRLGGKIVLSAKEKKVNETLMAMKEKEFQIGLAKGPFPPAIHFMLAKPLIDQSEVFDVIKMMPKGAALHVHDISLVNISWVISNLTYLPNLYYCNITLPSKGIHFSFSSNPPMPNCSSWELLADARKKVGSNTFDQWLFLNLSMVTDDPHTAYPNTYQAWDKFTSVLGSVNDLVYSTEEVFQSYMSQALLEFYEDNVQYVEIRYVPTPLTANGTKQNLEYTLKKFINIAKEFVKQYADFYGAKFISQSIRINSKSVIGEDIRNAIHYKKTYPEYFAGHDLVAQEDTGYPLLYYINELLLPSQTKQSLPFFFHAGETDWEGTFVDENLLDAILLNTTRIGHGYAITKHPVAMEMAKKRGIAIEVNPVSNQVLVLVDDLRNHPAASLIAQDYPLVISSDDPAAWDAKPLSHDFYEAFMGLAGGRGDLATLKQFALNSIEYSATTNTEKAKMKSIWTIKWNDFLDQVLDKYGGKYLKHL